MSTYSQTTWVSHSSMSDFTKCPKSYYYRSVYKDPKTNRKISIVNPALVLGSAVHEVLESLSLLPVTTRMEESLLAKYENVWKQYSGRNGGFKTTDEEMQYKERGILMLQRVIDNPGPLANKALILKSDDPSFPLPRYILSPEHNIMLCGKIDWMEYIEESNGVHIIDFKTGKHTEDPNSLQLAIYCLLVKTLQKRTIDSVSYWYLETDDAPTKLSIPDCDKAIQEIINIGLQMKKARLEKIFECVKGSCYACRPYEAIINGDAEFIRTADYQDIYYLN